MANEMIERVARAICVSMGELPDTETPYHPRVTQLWQHYIPTASLAIKAMRVPTKEMMSAGIKRGVAWEYGDRGDPDAPPHTSEDAVYHAMIDAALKETP